MSTLESSTLVIIPTYNEIENLPLITGRVREAVPEVHILICLLYTSDAADE